MPEQTLGGIPLGLRMVMQINFLNFYVQLLQPSIHTHIDTCSTAVVTVHPSLSPHDIVCVCVV